MRLRHHSSRQHRDRRAHRTRQGQVEHPPRAALLARRVLRPRASSGRRSWGHDGAWRQQGVRRPVHDQRYGRSRNHCNMDHARYERNARPVCLNSETLAGRSHCRASRARNHIDGVRKPMASRVGGSALGGGIGARSSLRRADDLPMVPAREMQRSLSLGSRRAPRPGLGGARLTRSGRHIRIRAASGQCVDDPHRWPRVGTRLVADRGARCRHYASAFINRDRSRSYCGPSAAKLSGRTHGYSDPDLSGCRRNISSDPDDNVGERLGGSLAERRGAQPLQRPKRLSAIPITVVYRLHGER